MYSRLPTLLNPICSRPVGCCILPPSLPLALFPCMQAWGSKQRTQGWLRRSEHGCLIWRRWAGGKLYTAAYDGVIRCLDPERGEFTLLGATLPPRHLCRSAAEQQEGV